MNHYEDSSVMSNYTFPRWSTTISRPHSSLPSKDAVNDMFKLGIDNRKDNQKSETILTKRIIQHHVRIPTGTRLTSPPNLTQPSSTPDLDTITDHSSLTSINSRYYHSIPIRIKSTSLTIPITKTKEILLQKFPKQIHEKRKITHERKRRKQQAQTLAEKYAETDTWFQLRRSLAELKRLATTEEILVDPSTSLFNCDGHSFTTLKQVIAEQQDEKKGTMFKSESGMSSSFGSTRASATTSQSSFTRSRTAKQSTETYPRLVFEPLIVATKPIHSILGNNNDNNSLLKTRIKSHTSTSSRPRSNYPTIPLSEEKRSQLLLSDLSNDENIPISSTPSSPLVKTEQEILPSPPSKIISSPIRLRAPSTIQLTSTIKLKSQPPRCRSANDIKISYSINKTNPRFILIADQEHRIESWYHQYPFILSDDLLTLFQTKTLQQKFIISAYFIDDLQSSNSNITAKTFLQGKPFHINNDWKKYDLIFISNNIYEQIIIYLQTIIKLSGKIIKIYQVNHDEDLKKQVKNICKQIQQENV